MAPLGSSLCILFLLCLSTFCGLASGSSPRIAVIGAGIAESMKPVIKFHRGRVNFMTVGKDTIELGGSIYHVKNIIVDGLVRKFGLQTRNAMGGTTGIWSPDGFIFEESSWKLINLFKILWRYGKAPLHLKAITDEVVEKWMKIYEPLNSTAPLFHSVEEAFQRLKLSHLLSITLDEFLINQHKMDPRFVREFIAAVTRVQYGQAPSTLHALVGLVSLVGAEEGSLLSVKGGNRQMVEAAKVGLHLSSRVIEVRVADDGGIKVLWVEGGIENQIYEERFDGVIIAAPLDIANITLVHTKYPLDEEKREFQRTVATFVSADGLNPAYFGSGGNLPTEILTVEDARLEFTSVAEKTVVHGNDGKEVKWYKMFSRDVPSDKYVLSGFQALLQSVFINPKKEKQIPWLAYPVLHPTTSFPPIELAPRLFYANAFEFAISTMETEALAGLNCARLLMESL